MIYLCFCKNLYFLLLVHHVWKWHLGLTKSFLLLLLKSHLKSKSLFWPNKTNDTNDHASSKNILRNKSWALSQPGIVMWASASRTYFVFIDSLSTSYLVFCSAHYSTPPTPMCRPSCGTCSLTPLIFKVCPQFSSSCLAHASLRGLRERDKYFFQLCHIEASWMTSCSWEWRGVSAPSSEAEWCQIVCF